MVSDKKINKILVSLVFAIFCLGNVHAFGKIAITRSYASLGGSSRTKGDSSRRLQLQCVSSAALSIGNPPALSSSQSSKASIVARESLAGVVTALATIPTSVAYATVVGVSPLVGIWSSAITGFFTAFLGREPGLIAAAAGVIAIPISKIYKQYGSLYMAATIITAGILEFLFGYFKIGTRIGLYCEDSCDVFSGSHISPPIIAGFMNAFGLFLLKSQYKLFHSFTSAALPPSIFTALVCVLGINLFPKIVSQVPGSLLGLVFASVLSMGLLKLPILTLSQYAGPSVFSGGFAALPTFIGPNLLSALASPTVSSAMHLLGVILPTSVGIATISILETAITAEISGNNYIMKDDDGDYIPRANRAIRGLGVGNIVSALFGGFGGCGVIPNTQLNNRSGGRGVSSSIAYAFSLALAVVAFAPVIGQLPLAALGGLMVQVAFNTIEWSENREILSNFWIFKHSNTKFIVDLLTLVTTTITCIKVDMGVGVLAGIAVSKVGPVIDEIKRRMGLLEKTDASLPFEG